jgi:hypothetical protein
MNIGGSETSAFIKFEFIKRHHCNETTWTKSSHWSFNNPVDLLYYCRWEIYDWDSLSINLSFFLG